MEKTSNAFMRWVIILAFIPIIMFFSSIQIGGEFSNFQFFLRAYWVPAIIFEIVTLFIALHAGWKPIEQLRDAQKIIKIPLYIWMSSMFFGSLFIAYIPAISMISTMVWFIHIGFFGAVYFLIHHWEIYQKENFYFNVSSILSIASVSVTILIVIYTFIIGHDAKYDWVSALPGFSNVRHIGYIQLIGASLSVGALALHYNKWFHTLLLIINLVLIIWFGSRGVFFAILLAIVLNPFLLKKCRNIKYIILLGMSFLIALILSQLVPTPPSDSYNILNRFDDRKIENVQNITSGRTELWKDAVSMTLEKPFIGNGTDQYKYTAPAAQGASRHPHNFILQIFFEWGFIGGLSFLFLLFQMARQIFQNTLNGLSYPPYIMTLLAVMIFGMIDGIIFYALPIAMLSLIIVLTISQVRQDNI